MDTPATITGLVPQKRRKDRINVHLDGEYAFSLAGITAARLSVGMEVTEEEIEKLSQADAYESAKQSAIRFVSYRPRSVSEVKKNLRRKQYDNDIIERVVDRLKELELLDDEKFAHYWVDQRETFKPRSRRAIRYELFQKGVNRQVIDAAVEDLDENSAAYRAGLKRARRWAGKPEDKFRLDMKRFLQRRGFNYGVIRSAIDKLWQEVTETG